MKNVDTGTSVSFAYVRAVRGRREMQWWGKQAEAEQAMAADIEATAKNPNITPLHVQDAAGTILTTAVADSAPAKPAARKGRAR